MKLLQNVRVAIRVVILTGLVALALAGTVNLARADETSMPSATPTPWPPSPTPEGWLGPDVEAETVYVVTEVDLREISLSRYIFRLKYATPGVAGVWQDESDVYCVGLTTDADRETIVNGFTERGVTDVRVVTMKYTYVELCEAANSAVGDFANAYDPPVVTAASVNERENCVIVDIYSQVPEETQTAAMQAIAERFGDMIRFQYTDALNIDLTGTGEVSPGFWMGRVDDGSTSYKYFAAYYVEPEPKKAVKSYVIVLAAVFSAAILGAAILLRRQNARVRVTADGRTDVSGRTYTDAEIEALAKSAARDVSEAGRRRIFEAYERER